MCLFITKDNMHFLLMAFSFCRYGISFFLFPLSHSALPQLLLMEIKSIFIHCVFTSLHSRLGFVDYIGVCANIEGLYM